MRKKRGLRLWILLLLGRAPRNGAEIMDDMERRTHGRWRPSPGSVYPLLEEMTKDGSIRKRDDGRYEVAGGSGLHRDWAVGFAPRTAQEAVREIDGIAAYLEDLKQARPDFARSVEGDLDAVIERLRHLKG